MTRSIRRDKGVKFASVITGLRMEPKLAADLTAVAHEHAEVRAANMGGGSMKADIAFTTRYLLRQALKFQSPDHDEISNGSTPVAGLRCEAALANALRREQKKTGMTLAGTARHLLRVALGASVSESLDVENRFAMIAEARRGLSEETT